MRRLTRHRWEIPLVVLSGLFTVAVVGVFALAIVLILVGSPEISNQLVDALVSAGEEVWLILLLPLVPFIVVAIRLVYLAKPRATGVPITAEQFPAAHALLTDLAAKAGLAHLPDARVVTGSVPMGSTTAGVRQHTIMLHHDLFEVARPDGDQAPLRFAIAREIGHIAAGHHGVLRQLFTSVTQSMPVVMHIIPRAEEYTADRWAAWLAGDAAPDYLGLVGASKLLWPAVDARELSRSAGQSGIAELVVSFSLPEPPLTWRARAFEGMGIFAFESRAGALRFAGRPAEPERTIWLSEPSEPRHQIAAIAPLGDVEILRRKAGQGALWRVPKRQRPRV